MISPTYDSDHILRYQGLRLQQTQAAAPIEQAVACPATSFDRHEQRLTNLANNGLGRMLLDTGANRTLGDTSLTVLRVSPWTTRFNVGLMSVSAPPWWFNVAKIQRGGSGLMSV